MLVVEAAEIVLTLELNFKRDKPVMKVNFTIHTYFKIHDRTLLISNPFSL